MPQTPLLVFPSGPFPPSQQIEAFLRFAVEESRHRTLREEVELQCLHPHYRPRVEYSRHAKETLILTEDYTNVTKIGLERLP